MQSFYGITFQKVRVFKSVTPNSKLIMMAIIFNHSLSQFRIKIDAFLVVANYTKGHAKYTCEQPCVKWYYIFASDIVMIAL